MSKRGNNEGSIYFDTSVNLYRGAVMLADGRRKIVSAKTRKAASDKLTALQGQLAVGLPVSSTDRLGVFLDWWLGTLEAKVTAGHKSANTVDSARWACEVWIKPTLGTRRLRDLTAEDVESLLAGMAAAGKSHGTLIRVRSWLGQALTVAQRRGKVARNVARIAEMPATARAVPRRSLTPDEGQDLLTAAKGNRLFGLIAAGLMLGLRPGELTGLRWADIDFAANRIGIEHSLKNERGQLRVGAPKTARSRRVLQMPAPVRKALKSHQERQAQERLRAGEGWNESGLVFTTAIGTPINPSNLRRACAGLTASAGLGRRSPNELRHSAASLLSAAGVPLEVIADVLGHTSTRMLEQHYRHPVKPSVDAQVSVMDQLFGDDSAGPDGQGMSL